MFVNKALYNPSRVRGKGPFQVRGPADRQEMKRIDYPDARRALGALPRRQRALDDDRPRERLLTPFNHAVGKGERYYQQIAINRAVEAILKGKRRLLLTMATGTGKTAVAFQICWKLWTARWNRTGEHRKPRILFLADRNILVDDPKDKIFAAVRRRPPQDRVRRGRQEPRDVLRHLPGDRRGRAPRRPVPRVPARLLRPHHRRRVPPRQRPRRQHLARDPRVLRAGLPARHDGDAAARGQPRHLPLLRQPALHVQPARRASTTASSRPTACTASSPRGTRPAGGPARASSTATAARFPTTSTRPRTSSASSRLRARTEAIARHLTDFLKKTDRFAKTIVFCVDQEHADEMRAALDNLNADLVQQHPDYVCRVTADEGDIGRGHLSRFQDVETQTPVILTTSQLLTTGVDAPTCKNVVLARVVGSMTRVQADHRPRHARPRRLRQAVLQHPRLHRLGHPPVRRPGLRRRPGAADRGGDRRRRARPSIADDRRRAESRRRRREPDAGRSSSRRAERAPQVLLRRRAGRDRRRTWSTSSTPTASSSASSATPTTRPRRCARCARSPPTCATRWADPDAARRDHRARSQSAASTSTSWPRPRTSPTPTRSTCSATSPSTPRCAPAASARSGCAASARTSSTSYGPEARADPGRAAREVRRARRRAVRAARRAASPADLRATATSPRSSSLFGGAEQLRAGRDRTAGPSSMPRRRTTWRKNSAARRRTADHRPAARQPPQVRARHHAQGQGAERRPRPAAAAHLDHVPQVPRRPGAAARGRGEARRQEVPPGHRAAVPLARLGGEAAGHHRRRAARRSSTRTKHARPTARKGPGLFAYLRGADQRRTATTAAT